MLICFQGVDGSGKSLQAQRLVERLQATGYPATYVWGGGQSSLAMPLIRIGKWLLKGPRKHQLSRNADATVRAQYDDYLATTQRYLKRPMLRAIWRHIFLADHTLEIWRTIVPALMWKRIVVCDRYIYDSVIRVAVMTGMTAEDLPRLLNLPPAYAVPMPRQWFLLDVPAEVAYQRKDDILDVAFLERRIPFYQAAAKALTMDVIDATRTPDEISELIWQRMQPLLVERKRFQRQPDAVNRIDRRG